MIEHNPELERLEVLRQELRQEIDDLHSEICCTTAYTRFLNAQKEYYDKRAEAERISVFTVARDGYGTEPHHRVSFSTYEDAERIAVKFIRGGFTNVAIISQSPAAQENPAVLKRLKRRYHEARALRYQPDES